MLRILFVLLLAGCMAPVSPVESSGAMITCGQGGTYFEHEAPDGGWEPIGWLNADGGHPHVGQAIQGYWYLPPDAGPVRLYWKAYR